ncbi:MAG: polysaccharide biosynthesis C-terminal domain-containing protein [Acidobacteria bacterium]|nr:polysaccharide biosynthesis C-terminal domain-containing protein [Acidobacteriota bacterium]
MSAIARDSLGILAFRILLYVATFLSGVVVSRALGPTGRGEYYLPFLGAATLVTVAKCGIDQGALLLYGDRRYGLGGLWRASRRASWTLGSLSMLLLVASPWLLPTVYATTPVSYLVLAAATIPLQMEAMLGGALLTVAGRVMVQFRSGLIAVLVQAAMLGALWLTTGLTPGLVLASSVIGAIVTWVIIARSCHAFPAEELRSTWIRDVLAASLPLHVSSMLLWMHVRLDMFMVSAIAGTAMLGLYSLAVMLAETVQLATDSLGTALVSRQATGELADAARLGLLGARVNTVVGGGIALGWGVVAPVLVPLVFGREFVDAVWPLIVLLPGMVALGWQRACGAAIVRAGRPWLLVAIHAVAVATNALLTLWWVPVHGAVGASLASMCSYGLSAVAILGWTLRLANAPLRDAIPGRADVAVLWSGVARVLGRARAVPEARHESPR